MTVPKSISDDGLLSTSQVAEKLGVHRSTVWLYIHRGALASEKHGSFHGVRPAALLKFQNFYKLDDREQPTRKKRKKNLEKKRGKRGGRKHG
jgi:excisionase family DNA binding protein